MQRGWYWRAHTDGPRRPCLLPLARNEWHQETWWYDETRVDLRGFIYEPPVHQNSQKQTGAAEHKERDAFTVTIVAALSGKHIFGPWRIQRREKVKCLLRRLHHLSYPGTEMSGKHFQLLHNDHILDPSMPVLQSTDPLPSASESTGILDPSTPVLQSTDEVPELVLTMIYKPLLLTWEQLVAMPAMRNRAGRGGRNACVQQRLLRIHCFENDKREVDLSDADYDWRLLLKNMSKEKTLLLKDVIGVGVTRFTFRLLDNIDCNYAPGGYAHARHGGYTGERHVFEVSCADGDRWHLHFNTVGSCEVEHLQA
jgi:hypothetical protein